MTRGFKINENEKYFRYELAGSPSANMLFTTRRGGVSEGRYSSLNMGYSTCDSKENIYKNRAIVLNDFDLSIDRMTSSDQVHGVELRAVRSCSEDAGECDGLFTDAKNTVLSMYFADCTPLFFYDPVKKAIGLSHAGWRGTVGDIASKSVGFMKEKYGSSAGDIIAVIGPSIGKCCFEVGSEVEAEFTEKLNNINVKEYIGVKEERAGKFYIDLKAINKKLLESAGIKSENIHVHDACTSCMKDFFYSYRRDAGDTGRMAALAFIE
ncbi:MAG: Laccase domain protein YfiH [bacterium ADurb.Bin243]|nr:MAG: Laccase domain protein YfiH [bacterium ADurb.Bin243]